MTDPIHFLTHAGDAGHFLSQAHPLRALLRHRYLHRDALIHGTSLAGTLGQRFGFVDVTGGHESLHLMLRPNVIGWPHFPHLEVFGNDANRVVLRAKREERRGVGFRP